MKKRDKRLKKRKGRRLLKELAGEFLIQIVPCLIFSAVGGTVYAAYLAGGIGLALMLIPLWVWLFYRWCGRADFFRKKQSNRTDGGAEGR